MTDINILSEKIKTGAFDARLKEVYNQTEEKLNINKKRLVDCIEGYKTYFKTQGEGCIFSAPGRTEIGGNHTDHQHGRVLAGSVDLDVIATAVPNGTNKICIKSEGFPEDIIDLGVLTPVESEKNTSASLIRGVAAEAVARGFKVSGFNAYTTSNVLKGSGLSSSAAFEVLVGVMVDHFFCNDSLGGVEIAKIGQKAENEFFGKPCGLMDQMASAVGGIISIDFKQPTTPVINKVGFNFAQSGYSLCIVDTGGDHANLTHEYAAIPQEMKMVAACLGCNVLRETSKEKLLENIKEIRATVGDRGVLRAMHFFEDDERAEKEAQMLAENDFDGFLKLVTQSGNSSFKYLQNVFCASNTASQPVSFALCLCEELLGGDGAVRVHGGGFAGTVQAFVPNEKLDSFKSGIEKVLGKGMCHVLTIRPVGGCTLF